MRKRARRLLALAGLITGLVVLVFLYGMTLPRQHRASSAITLAAPPDSVWAVVSDLGALLGHWKELELARRLPDRDGKAVWEQVAGGFAMTLIVEEATPPSHLVTRIDAPPDAEFGGRWLYDLVPAGGGTRVRVTEDGWVRNPLFRVILRATGEHRTLDGYLEALGARFRERVTPEHL